MVACVSNSEEGVSCGVDVDMDVDMNLNLTRINITVLDNTPQLRRKQTRHTRHVV